MSKCKIHTLIAKEIYNEYRELEAPEAYYYVANKARELKVSNALVYRIINAEKGYKWLRQERH